MMILKTSDSRDISVPDDLRHLQMLRLATTVDAPPFLGFYFYGKRTENDGLSEDLELFFPLLETKRI
jgi:hypothetical protein